MRANKTNAALLLDGRTDDEATLALAHEALVDGLVAGGWTVDDWRLRDEKMAWCTGCFGTAVHTRSTVEEGPVTFVYGPATRNTMPPRYSKGDLEDEPTTT